MQFVSKKVFCKYYHLIITSPNHLIITSFNHLIITASRKKKIWAFCGERGIRTPGRVIPTTV